MDLTQPASDKPLGCDHCRRVDVELTIYPDAKDGLVVICDDCEENGDG